MHLTRRITSLDSTSRAVAQAARREIVAARQVLTESVRAMGPRAARNVTAERERTDQRARRLHLVDPRRVVERGYALLRSAEGAVLTDAEKAPPGTRVLAELRRGRLTLRSEGTSKTSTEDESNAQER